MAVKLVLDATPIINFNDRIKRPDLLLKFFDLGYILVTTDKVHKEISKGKSISFLEDCITRGKIKLLNTNEKDFEQLKAKYPFLADGELSTMYLGLKTNEGSIVHCVLDDKKAVQIAQDLGINARGSYGLLEELVKKQIISKGEFENLIEKMITEGFFLKKSHVNL